MEFELSTEAQLDLAKEYIMNNIDVGLALKTLLRGYQVFQQLMLLDSEGSKEAILQGLSLAEQAMEELLKNFTVQIHNISIVLGLLDREEVLAETAKNYGPEEVEYIKNLLNNLGRPQDN
jgi:hypothetical protein